MSLKVQIAPVLLFAMLCGVVGSAGADDDAEPGSKGFRVEEQRLEIGDIKAGAEAVGTFVFHNDSEQDVKIIRAKPS